MGRRRGSGVSSPSPSHDPSRPAKASPWGFVGMGAMACVLFLDLATMTRVPWWATVVLVVAWLVLFAMACRAFVPAPARVVWLAVTGFVTWVLVVVGGGLAFGWS